MHFYQGLVSITFSPKKKIEPFSLPNCRKYFKCFYRIHLHFYQWLVLIIFSPKNLSTFFTSKQAFKLKHTTICDKFKTHYSVLHISFSCVYNSWHDRMLSKARLQECENSVSHKGGKKLMPFVKRSNQLTSVLEVLCINLEPSKENIKAPPLPTNSCLGKHPGW